MTFYTTMITEMESDLAAARRHLEGAKATESAIAQKIYRIKQLRELMAHLSGEEFDTFYRDQEMRGLR